MLRMLSARHTAEMLDTTPDTLKYWRLIGKGPTPYKVGARWKYNQADVQAFVESCRCDASVAGAVERQLDRL